MCAQNAEVTRVSPYAPNCSCTQVPLNDPSGGISAGGGAALALPDKPQKGRKEKLAAEASTASFV